MPHLLVHTLDRDLDGREADLIATITDAIVAVYGDWAREHVVVQLIGVPPGRWGVGGKPAVNPAPRVMFGIRDGVFSRPDGPEILGRLATGVTDAIATTIGEHVRKGTTIEFVGAPDGRTAIGGALVTY
ncbi:tautomerase family protein [Cryptosporangium japonicum]|uniref:4-oxalocrotonate tautomerase-like domain-containing protein n=1 Tax=Cryptosporangium japonicum TaxID=80872 RepID=A0ABN0U570_9ACTN